MVCIYSALCILTLCLLLGYTQLSVICCIHRQIRTFTLCFQGAQSLSTSQAYQAIYCSTRWLIPHNTSDRGMSFLVCMSSCSSIYIAQDINLLVIHPLVKSLYSILEYWFRYMDQMTSEFTRQGDVDLRQLAHGF